MISAVKNFDFACDLRTAYRFIKREFDANGIEDAAFDTDAIIKHVTGKDRRLYGDFVLSKQQAECLRECALKRCERYPLQYIIGEWDFLDFTLKIGEGVLIPRCDTEIVCQTAIEFAKDFCAKNEGAEPNIADFCAGSGAIAIGIKKSVPDANVSALELSSNALFYLNENVKTLAPEIEVIQGDIFTYQDDVADNFFDIIVSNPPYITEQEMKLLAPELSFEPNMALFAEDDGLCFYKHIAKAYKSKIKHGGALIFEIGSEQANKVHDILKINGYKNIEIINDLFGKQRCVKATL